MGKQKKHRKKKYVPHQKSKAPLVKKSKKPAAAFRFLGRAYGRISGALPPLFMFLMLVLSFYSLSNIFLSAVSIDITQISTFTFTALWCLMGGMFFMLMPYKAARPLYIIVYIIFWIYCYGQYVYYCMFDDMFRLSVLSIAGEGFEFAGSAFERTKAVYNVLFTLMLVVGFVVQLFLGYIRTGIRFRTALPIFAVITAAYIFSAKTLPDDFSKGKKGTWGEWKNDYHMYLTCGDPYIVTRLTGIQQYTAKYIQGELKKKFADHTEEAAEANEFLADMENHTSNLHTNELKGKNVIFVLMESIDDWLITEETMPNLYAMKDNSYWFTNFYTPLFGAAATFNSEYTANTGYFTPIDESNTCTAVGNNYGNSIANLFRAAGYSAQSFHKDKGDFYNRLKIHKALGYEQYNTYLDYAAKSETSYDDIIVKNDDLYNKLTNRSDAPFMDYVISYSAHLSYSSAGVITQEAYKRHPELKDTNDVDSVKSIKAKARLTDDMFGGLIERLKEDGKLEDTVIIGFTDHYAYGLDEDILYEQEKPEYNDVNMLSHNAFFIYNSDIKPTKVTKVCNTADMLPTICNLFGLKSDYRYIGHDIFDSGYEGIAFFNDYSWVNSKCYYNNGIKCQWDVITDDEIDKWSRYAATAIQVNKTAVDCDLMCSLGK